MRLRIGTDSGREVELTNHERTPLLNTSAAANRITTRMTASRQQPRLPTSIPHPVCPSDLSSASSSKEFYLSTSSPRSECCASRRHTGLGAPARPPARAHTRRRPASVPYRLFSREPPGGGDVRACEVGGGWGGETGVSPAAADEVCSSASSDGSLGASACSDYPPSA